jgi:hypothetical protein
MAGKEPFDVWLSLEASSSGDDSDRETETNSEVINELLKTAM